MTVDDVSIGVFYVEGIQDLVHYCFLITQFEVVPLLFMVRLFVGNEISLEGRHLRLVEQRTIGTTPQVEEIVDGILVFLVRSVMLEGGTYHHTRLVHQLSSYIFPSGINLYFFQCAVLVEWDRGVKQQVAVKDGVHAPMLQKQSHVLVQFLADHERMAKSLHQFLFFGRQFVGMLRIYCGEIMIVKLIFFSVQCDSALLIVHEVEECSVLHLPLGMTFIELRLFLELNNRNSLVHECCEAQCLLCNFFGTPTEFGIKSLARVVSIGLHGKGS